MKFGTRETGAACRAHILSLLAQGPMTGADMAQFVGRKVKTVQDHLRTMAASGDVHVYDRIGHNLNTKLYAIGPGMDASNVTARVILALQRQPMTVKELCAALDESSVTVRKVCSRLRDPANRRIYVKEWTRKASECFKAEHVYAIGSAMDRPKPQPLTAEETSARAREKLRARLKEDPVRHINHLMAKRRSYARKNAYVPVDPFMAQFSGVFGRRDSRQESA